MGTPLDNEFARLLQPIVRLNMHFAAAPFVNTLCLAYHYWLALESAAAGSHTNRIQLTDWNQRSVPRTIEDLAGFHMFYSTKTVADRLKLRPRGGRAGFYNSLPVTRFRQQHAFIRRDPNNIAFLQRHNEISIKEIAKDFLLPLNRDALERAPFVLTDIYDQAKGLVCRAIGSHNTIQYIHPGNLLAAHNTSNNNFALFVFSAPCSEYMLRRHHEFIRLDVDGLNLEQDDAFETHIIWHLPQKHSSDDALSIKSCLEKYHTRLFSAAMEEDAAPFEGLRTAIVKILSVRHPSSASEIFQKASDFQQCVRDYHISPPAHMEHVM